MNLLSAEAKSLGLLPDLGKVATSPKNSYLHTVVSTYDLGICSCLEMAPRNIPNYDPPLGLSYFTVCWSIQ